MCSLLAVYYSSLISSLRPLRPNAAPRRLRVLTPSCALIVCTPVLLSFGTSIKVIGNVGINSTKEAIHATEQGFAVCMHAALHINPYYGKTSMQGLVSHFGSVLPMGPIIIYNVPPRTGQDIPSPVIQAISQNPNFAGVKECLGNERIKAYIDEGIMIWSGNDDQCHDARWVFGATGVISVASNLVPGLMHDLMFRGLNPALNSKQMALFEWLFCEPNPISLATALAQLGVVRPIFRLPYFPLPLEKREKFLRIVKAIGREYFVGTKDVLVLNDDDFIQLRHYLLVNSFKVVSSRCRIYGQFCMSNDRSKESFN